METLRAWRAERLMSTRRLAELAKTSNKTIVQIENGRHIPSYATIAKICRALEVSPRDVVEFARALDTRGGLVSRPSPAKSGPARRVICVGDSGDVVALVQRLLATGVYEATRLGSTDDAFDAIVAARPDVVILALESGRPAGWDLLCRLRADPVSREIPVVVRAEGAWLAERGDPRRATGGARAASAPLSESDFSLLLATIDQVTHAAAAPA